VPPVNVVRIAKTTWHPQARAQVTLCSSALDLSSTPRGDYDGLRCPIAFPCRDATPYWGLEDCRNVTPAGVTKAAPLSLGRVNGADRLQAEGRQRDPDARLLDVPADCRASKYVEETIQMLPEKPEPVL
jgi:putative transposase